MRYLLAVMLLCGQLLADGQGFVYLRTLDETSIAQIEADPRPLKLIYVHAWWCGHCIMYQPSIQRFSSTNQTSVGMYQVNYNASLPYLRQRFDINDRGYVVAMYQHNKQPIEAIVRYPDDAQLTEWLQAAEAG